MDQSTIERQVRALERDAEAMKRNEWACSCLVAVLFVGLLILAGAGVGALWAILFDSPSNPLEHVGGSHAWDEERR